MPEEIQKRDVAVLTFIDRDKGLIFLIRTNKLPNSWQPVGGGVDPNDNSPIDAVIREVSEETNLRLTKDQIDFQLEAPYDFGEGTVYFYTAELSSDTQVIVDQSEIAEGRWFTLKAALEVPIHPATKKFLHYLEVNLL